MTFKIYTLGCKVNFYDSNSVKDGLLKHGFKIVNKGADLVIVNTCSVTKIAQRKDRQAIVKARKENLGAKIVVMGCLVVADNEAAKSLGADLVWPVGKIDELVKILSSGENKNNIQINSSHEINITSIDRSRYFIKVQDGCEQFCSYCIIPYTRGGLKSRGVDEVIKEIAQATEKGFREVVLSGIHLGLFGKEKKNKSLDLVGLLRKILSIENIGRIRLSSIEVTEISDELIELMVKEKRICHHLHIPLQSGCDPILKRMNRPYDIKFFAAKIAKLRKVMPDIAITTDVIVGFPGETEEYFKETEKFIKEINFSQLHVFSFSAHERTVAAKMENKVEIKEIKKRSELLRKLSEKLEKSYKVKFRGRELEIIIEKRQGGKFIGKSEYYFDIEVDGKERCEIGSLALVKKWK